MGRKKIDIDWKLLDGVLQYKPSMADCEEHLGCSHDVIEKNIKEKFGLTFVEYRDRKMKNTRMKLVQRALKMAFNENPTMLIFCLKNLCNWSDKVEIEEKSAKPFKFTYNPITAKINKKKTKAGTKKVTRKKVTKKK